MPYEPKPNTGSLWINDRKEKDTHPDRKGDALIECPHCKQTHLAEIGGWLRKTQKTGEKYMWLSIKPKEDRPRRDDSQPAQPPARRAPSVPPPEAREDRDDIPF